MTRRIIARLGYLYLLRVPIVFAVKAPSDFGRGGRFEEQGEGLDEVGSRLLNRGALARNVELRAQRYKTVVLTFDDRGE